MPLNTPILFIIFNRPDTTAKVFEAIRLAKPTKLFVSADGPRIGRAGDEEKCLAARAIIDKVDWECEVVMKFEENNLGCRGAVSSAISWFFSQVEYGIVLEDDCLPHPTFFEFCTACLERYKDDDRVFHINGSNYQSGWVRDADHSYYFSRWNSIWGWASWARAWKYYDVNIPLWEEVKRKKYHYGLSPIHMEVIGREQAFDSVYENRLNTWDFQWSFTIFSQNGLSIVPNVNLISNIGFDGEATHTVTRNKRSNLPTEAIALPVKHPPYMIPDQKSDIRNFNLHGKRGYTWRLKNLLRLLMRS